MNFLQTMHKDAELVTQELERRLQSRPELAQSTIIEAMRYSLLAGGKRIRPVLTLEFCKAAGGREEDALPFACAIEMVHTYSLIHDDLPCMDDDDYRRGKLTNHKVFGENIAVLAGDALLNFAFETVLSQSSAPSSARRIPAEAILKASGALADFSGIYGMIGGQVIDLQSEHMVCGLDRITKMDLHKTAALMRACAAMGCIVGGGSEAQLRGADCYAEKIGLAFQIEDDILDVAGDFEKLGKLTGSDAKSQKNTYVSLLGPERSKAWAKELTDQAIAALDVFPEHAFLAELANNLLNRES